MRRFLPWLGLILGCRLFAAEVIPPAPAQYFNDYAKVVAPNIAARLNQILENFERESSDQILVAVFPTMRSDSSVEDYTVRVARAWKVGQKSQNNGAVLFVFVQDHKVYLQVGYGLEAVLPDALCKRIIDEQISPRFKVGDFNGGLSAGVQSILAAVKGEYRGTGGTVAESRGQQGHSSSPLVVILFIVFIVIVILTSRSSGSRLGAVGWLISSGGGGGWSGGGGGGGGGGFSGGGGSFGGGGAGGSW